jgi:hypothetical protein
MTIPVGRKDIRQLAEQGRRPAMVVANDIFSLVGLPCVMFRKELSHPRAVLNKDGRRNALFAGRVQTEVEAPSKHMFTLCSAKPTT